MSSKNVEIPYSLLAQGIQKVSYPADTLYAQTMNAPAPVSLDMYLNNHLTDNRTIQPNYELNLENIDIDEVKVSMETSFNLANIALENSFSISSLVNSIYNPNNNLTYSVSQTTTAVIYAMNSSGTVVYSYTFPTNYQANTLSYSQTVIDNANNIYTIVNNLSTYNYYIFKFDSKLNLIKSISVPHTYTHKNAQMLFIYNNNIYHIRNDGSPTVYLGIIQYSLNLTLVNSYQINNANFSTIGNVLTQYPNYIYNNMIYCFTVYGTNGYIYSIDLNNIYNFKLITFNLPISAYLGGGGSVLIYNPNINTTYLIYSNVNNNEVIIYNFQGSDINNFSISSYVTLSINISNGLEAIVDNNNNIWIFSAMGYGYILTPNGNTYIVLKTFSVSKYMYYYISTTSNSVIVINATNAYFFNNPTLQKTITNPNYQNSFNMILGCG